MIGNRRGARWMAVASFTAAVVGAAIAAAPRPAQACACCSEPGMRTEGTVALNEYTQGELARLRFGEVAQLVTGAAEFETIDGIDGPRFEYHLDASTDDGRFTLTLTADDGRTGTIVVPLGEQIHEFFVDTRQGDADAEPVLYKEWTVNARPTLSGFFARASKGRRPRARLVFHGSGNACTEAEQFNAWTLVVKGPGSNFTLMGKLEAPRA